MQTVADFLAALPEERRAPITAVRKVVNEHLPNGYEETLQYGAISWVVPFSRLARTYNGQPLAVAALGARKGYMTLHLMTVYGDAKLRRWFEAAFAKRGKKLNMGKACVRFKKVEDLPLDVIGEVIAKVPVDAYVRTYEASRAGAKTPKRTAAKKPKRAAKTR